MYNEGVLTALEGQGKFLDGNDSWTEILKMPI